jgi:hypothetical protein
MVFSNLGCGLANILKLSDGLETMFGMPIVFSLTQKKLIYLQKQEQVSRIVPAPICDLRVE